MPIEPSFLWTAAADLTAAEQEFFKRAWPDGHLPEDALIVGKPGVEACAVTVRGARVWEWLLFNPIGEIGAEGWEFAEVDVKLRVAPLLGTVLAA
jgi:hypothetical protein